MEHEKYYLTDDDKVVDGLTGAWVLECPMCGKIHASGDTRGCLPVFGTCEGDGVTDWKKQVESLRRIAEAAGATQVGIAERTGIKQGHVSRFFAGANVPRLDTFLRIAEAVGASVRVENNENV